MQVEDIWDETERVRPLIEPECKIDELLKDTPKSAQGQSDSESDQPLHFNLSDPDQIRQYCKPFTAHPIS